MIAEDLAEKVLGDEYQIAARYTGRELERWTYQRPFELVPLENANFVALADYVTTDRRHRARAPGPGVRRRRPRGRPRVRPAGGQADQRQRALRRAPGRWSAGCSSRTPTSRWSPTSRSRGLLFRHVPYTHSYPHCWRCHTPLMYYALPAWYIRTTAIKDRLLAENENDQLVPVDDQARPLRRLARQQHRLVAVPRPVLGHSPAGLAQRRGPQADGLRRFAGRAAASCPASSSTTRTGPSSTTSRSRARASPARTGGCRR